MAIPFHFKVLGGFALGTLAGIIAFKYGTDSAALAFLVDKIAAPAGALFLKLLKMMVLPLMFTALVLGVCELGDVRNLGRLGGRTLFYTFVLTSIAVLIGLTMVNLIQPGIGVDQAVLRELMEKKAGEASAITSSKPSLSGVDMVLGMVPDNVVKAAGGGDYLGVLFFGLMIGVGMVLTPSVATEKFKGVLQGLFEVSMTLINLIIKLAPYAIAALMFSLAAKFGWDILLKLAKFVLTVVGAIAIHMFIVLPLWVRFMGGMSPLKFFRNSQEALLMAFSTSSSAATLPTTLRVGEEELKLPPQISRFVLTIGATANQHGTALFEGITVIFLAQFFGIGLDLEQQLTVVGLSIIGGIGTAGVPSGSLPVIVMICGIVGIPPEGIAVVLGVDRFLDMCRTALNVCGDLATAVVVAKASELDPLPNIELKLPAGH